MCGFQGSGKDTVADYLVNVHGFRRISFAGTLKDAISCIFGWDRELLEGRTKQSREWREQVDTWWANKLGMPNLTPRWVLQYWGTDVCRKNFHDSIWISSVEHKLANIEDNIVISDVRFPNEIKSIKDSGGLVIRTKRGENPEWYHAAESRMATRLMADSLANLGPPLCFWRSDCFDLAWSDLAWLGWLLSSVFLFRSTCFKGHRGPFCSISFIKSESL